MNVPATETNDALLGSIGSSAKKSFASVYYISLSPSTNKDNYRLKGANEQEEIRYKISNDARLPSYVRASAVTLADIRDAKENTDDLAPVEAMTHGMLLDFLLDPGKVDVSKLV